MPLSATNLLALKSVVQQRIFTARYASMHKRWMRPYLKDLFHRRVIAGPDPVMARATLDNWNYPAEISAFSHRLQIPEVDPDLIVQALTNQTFFERKDVEEKASLAQPSKEQDTAQLQRCPSNEDLVGKGASLVRHILLTYLRSHWPKAPEEFIVAVAQRLASNTALTETAEHLGIQHICRTAEFPPSERTLHTALFSLINIMHQQQQQKTMEAENAKERGEDGVRKVRQFVCTFFLPRLQQLPLEDVLPFRHPLPIFKQYMYKWEKVDDIEPRVIASGGLSTAMPFYQVAIYADRDRIIGESAGEELWVALDLAAQNALLSLWRVTDEPRVFPYKLEEVYASRFERAQRQNHSIGDICAEDTDLSLYTSEELAQDPLDPSEMAQHYFTRVKPQLGLPHRKRLRHTFSRGSIGRFTRRFMVKPEPHNI